MATAAPTIAPDSVPHAHGAPTVAVAFDVADLDASTAFYARTLGFHLASVERAGLMYETRLLRSANFPCFELRLRAAFGKRPAGSGAGSVVYIRLTVKDLPALVNSIRDTVRWVGPAPAEPMTATEVEFLDPDGYAIRLGR